MDRAQKQEWIDTANGNYGKADILIVTHYKGLTVAEMTDLRGKVRAAGASFQVGKNRLAKLALKGTTYESISSLFVGPTAVTYANDPVAAAKVLAEFAKANEKLVLIGGAFGQQVLSKSEIQALATLPSLDELRAKLIALISTPATRIAGVLQAPAGQLARVFSAYGSKEA